MSALDALIEDAAVRLELGYRARTVVQVLVAWIASHPLGLDGLEQQFEQAGLGDHFQAWRRNERPLRPIIASELERAIGTHAITALARKAMLPPGMLRVLACELLPGLIAVVSPPAGSPRAAARVLRAPAQRHRIRGAAASQAMHGLALRSMLWLLVALVLVGVTSWVFLKMRTPLWVPAEVTHQSEPRLSLHNRGDRLEARGLLPGEADRRKLWTALIAVHGKPNVTGDIGLDRSAHTPRWLDRLVTRLPLLTGDGLQLAFEGDRLQVDTTGMDPEQRLAVSRLLRQDFADLQITGLWGPGLAALAQLPPGADPGALVAALNQTTLTFKPGSAELRGDSADTLAAVATALREASPGTRLEVGAHTDSRGQPDANRALSLQRAQTVVQALQTQGVPGHLLSAAGHGQDHPIADNRSEDGRARNRRIVYRIIANADPRAPQARDTPG
ncbi:OmpA family protein [Bacillus subtilis subsp. subtilis]|nr:OmpA family protein [Bacillus subtilis subsp. subtilis]